MADRVEDLKGLRPDERARLDAFGRAFERVDVDRYPTLTELSPTDDVMAAQERAIELVGDGPRKRAVRAAIGAFAEAASRAYSDRVALPDTFLLFQSRPDRGDDRARFVATLERAVVGVILWDALNPDELAALLGPWSAVVDLGNEQGV